MIRMPLKNLKVKKVEENFPYFGQRTAVGLEKCRLIKQKKGQTGLQEERTHLKLVY